MSENAALLIVDVDRFIERAANDSSAETNIRYPHGELREGFDAICELVTHAEAVNIDRYAVWYEPPPSFDNEFGFYVADQVAAHVPSENIFQKKTTDAFDCPLGRLLLEKEVRSLLVVGYNRDVCVFHTVKSALELGFRVATASHAMFTSHATRMNVAANDLFRARTEHLDSIDATHAWIDVHAAWS